MSTRPASKPTLCDVLLGNAVSMLLRPPCLLHMRAALKVMTQHLRHNWTPGMADLEYNAHRSLYVARVVLGGMHDGVVGKGGLDVGSGLISSHNFHCPVITWHLRPAVLRHLNWLSTVVSMNTRLTMKTHVRNSWIHRP